MAQKMSWIIVMRSEMFTAVKMWTAVYWAVMPHSLANCYCFRGTIIYTFRVDEGGMCL
jgi:hypothetical protein